MSSSKRRKLDAQGQGQQQAPASAVSAIAARRRLAASASQSQDDVEPVLSPAPESPASNVNSFSALHALKAGRETPKSPKASGKKLQPNVPRRTESPRPRNVALAKELSSIETDPKTAVDDHTTAQVVNYSSFRLSTDYRRTKSADIIELPISDSDRFVITGSFGVRVSNAEVSIAGATLRDSDDVTWIQAPHCVALPVLRVLESSERSRLEIHNDPHSTGLRKLGRLSPNLRKIWSESGDETPPGRTFQIICTSNDAPKRSVIQELVSPPAWNKKLASLRDTPSNSPCTAFVCGPKSAGKSTFSRLLTNYFLTRSHQGKAGTASQRGKGVAVIDLDPGQPEFAPSGTLSLVYVTKPNLGAPFTHSNFGDPANKILRCHSLASVTPASAPELYIECAMDLHETYRRTLRNCPLIINTPGWILGTGLDLLVDLITRIRPSEVIYMSEDGPTDVIEVLRDTTKQTFTTLPSQPSEFTLRTAAHFRSMQMMCYFHGQVRKDAAISKKSRINWSPQPLTSMRPVVVRYDGPKSGILGILSYDYQSPPDLLGPSIDGMILAVVEIEDEAAFARLVNINDNPHSRDRAEATEKPDVSVSKTADGLPFIPNANDATLDPRYSNTLGLAIVRGIDSRNKTLHLITPILLQEIERVRSQERQIVLVHGKFDPPSWAYTEDLYDKTAGEDWTTDKELQITEDSTSGDDSEEDSTRTQAGRTGSSSAVPWIETLKGNQKRPVGSRVWRVRRDLGRNNTE